MQTSPAEPASSRGRGGMPGLAYVGTAPNMMLRAIATHRGAQMPGYAGFMVLSSVWLLPVFSVLSAVFFI